MIKLANKWKDYVVLATGESNKLERWGNTMLLRPDPQVIWGERTTLAKYNGLHAIYTRDISGGGKWDILRQFAQEWVIEYPLGKHQLKLIVKPMGFKHTGVFPEQAVNWDLMYNLISNRSQCADCVPRVLNLFGYTGAASVACAIAGGKVVHVDAAKNMVHTCRQNAQLNGISDIRYIVDDCNKFVEREIRRGNKYDCIIMDPPSYGRGPNNEPWKLTDNICGLVSNAAQLLSDNPIFFVINSYTTGLQPSVLQNLLNIYLPSGQVQAYELALPTQEDRIILPCGCSAIWTR